MIAAGEGLGFPFLLEEGLVDGRFDALRCSGEVVEVVNVPGLADTLMIESRLLLALQYRPRQGMFIEIFSVSSIGRIGDW
jgi:hypothetical protein